MPVVELDAASLDLPLSLSSSETSASTSSSASNDEAGNNPLDDYMSPTYSSSYSVASDSDVESDESLGSSNNSFKLLDKIKQSSNKLNLRFLKRGRNKGVNTRTQKTSGNSCDIYKGGERTFATLTESFSSEDLSGLERSLPMIKGPISFESKEELDPGYYDVDGQYDDFEWAALAVPKGFNRIGSADTGLNAQIALTSPRASRVTEMMARFGVDGSSMISPGLNSDNSSDFGEEESRDFSLLDADGGQNDNSDIDDDNDSEGASIVSDDSVEDYTELDTFAALAGAVYQIGACNYKGFLEGYDDDEDDDSVGSDNLVSNDHQKRGRSRVPRTPPSDFDFVQQSKIFFGFADKESAHRTSSSGGKKTFLQSMFSSYVHG